MAEDPTTTVEEAKGLILEAIRVSAEALIEAGRQRGLGGDPLGIDANQVALLAQAWATVNTNIATPRKGARMVGPGSVS